MQTILSTIAIATLLGCASPLLRSATPPLSSASFNDLIGWNSEQAVAIRPVLIKSCQKLSRNNFSSRKHLGSFEQWQNVCQKLSKVDDGNMKSFFEDFFTVYRVSPNDSGLFTGYYSPLYEGRLQKEAGFEVPLLKVPDVNSKGKINRTDSRKIITQKIQSGKISNDEVLAWIKNPVDKFFLQIQGSGNIRLKDGSTLHVGYAGSNSQTYVAIGRILKQQKELKEISMETIRAWLESNPDKQHALFNQNPRYIFFTKTEAGAITAQGIPATPHRTMAIDPEFIPYGTPLWVDTELTLSNQPYRQMMVAQDTGSAIKGAVRGDIYMGMGSKAAAMAGSQQSQGKLYVIIPK